MSTIPPTEISGAGWLAERPIEDAPFAPCFDLIVDGRVLACLFYDDKPECAHASVDVENAEGELERVEGAAAGLDEREVGWCLQFTDEPQMVHVIARAPDSWDIQVRSMAWILLAARVEEEGIWIPADEFRLWGAAEAEDEDIKW